MPLSFLIVLARKLVFNIGCNFNRLLDMLHAYSECFAVVRMAFEQQKVNAEDLSSLHYISQRQTYGWMGTPSYRDAWRIKKLKHSSLMHSPFSHVSMGVIALVRWLATFTKKCAV